MGSEETEAEDRLTLFIGPVLRHGRLNTGFKKQISASSNKMRIKFFFLKKDITHQSKENGRVLQTSDVIKMLEARKQTGWL